MDGLILLLKHRNMLATKIAEKVFPRHKTVAPKPTTMDQHPGYVGLLAAESDRQYELDAGGQLSAARTRQRAAAGALAGALAGDNASANHAASSRSGNRKRRWHVAQQSFSRSSTNTPPSSRGYRGGSWRGRGRARGRGRGASQQ